MYEIAIIGAGASGLMLASFLQNKKVILIDTNKSIGAKIKVSGGAKCNITNSILTPEHYQNNSNLIQKTFNIFDNNNLLNFLSKHNIFPHINEKLVKGAYFCNSSRDVLEMFNQITSKTKKMLNTKIEDVTYDNGHFHIFASDKTIFARKLVIASGGLSYPILGSSSIGYKIAEKFNHTINKPLPALVGWTVQTEQFWFKELSGLSLNVIIDIQGKKIQGNLLFTHKGCSGPAVLSASLYWTKGLVTINFLPDKDSYLPKRFKQLAKQYNINLKSYSFAPAGTFGFSKAEVTKGGVNSTEINEDFESKFRKDLYFIGEVLDITGELGGYNFQWAFSSAYACAHGSLKKNSTVQ